MADRMFQDLWDRAKAQIEAGTSVKELESHYEDLYRQAILDDNDYLVEIYSSILDCLVGWVGPGYDLTKIGG